MCVRGKNKDENEQIGVFGIEKIVKNVCAMKSVFEVFFWFKLKTGENW
jgi:hypothetical protein